MTDDFAKSSLQTINLRLLFAALVVGAASGFVASLYRLMLIWLERWSLFIYSLAKKQLIWLPVIFVALLGFALVIAWMLQHYPMAGGSGIPQIKGQLQGYFHVRWLSTVLIKFIGGGLAILGGLSLGREGPSVQIGASVGEAVGIGLVKTKRQRNILMASGASAGLAAAFNAPLAGVMFTLEEIYKYFSPIILLSCMAAAVVSDAISRLLCGSEAVFDFHLSGQIPISDYGYLIVLGLVMGLFGAFYNWSLLKSQRLMGKVTLNIRVMISFLAAGLFGLYFPLVTGSGHALVDKISISWTLSFLALIFIGKFILSMISYSSGAPGGIFFPLLVLCAALGGIFAQILSIGFGFPKVFFANIIIIAMAAGFSAIVRAPITGMVLMIEMTGNFANLLPLAVVSLIAYVVAELLKTRPIYDSLLSRMLATQQNEENHAKAELYFEVLVQAHATAERKKVKDIAFPHNALLVSVTRGGEKLIPNGEFKIYAGDYLLLLTDEAHEVSSREQMKKLTEK
ncbi:MAG: ClC family H(+)/Cl(-) exchange transporter [Streptococcaceae bacterium]|jgi:H+/Cl- antiporter ClcA|nr:ClC family H(+)/Cl(-) exchange transporter [Streptococcaceae bacterium]